MQIPCKIILAPHEISEKNLLEAEKYFPDSVRYSLVNEANAESLKQKKVLLIDNVGYLSVLYRYGKIAYIGGAFGDGLHNILEPAVFGLPVIFGKEFRKFQEATDLVEAGGAFSVRNHAEAEKILLKLLQDNSFYNNTQKIILDYLEKQYGATQKVYNFLAEKKFIS
jgi:3-deoxy-D-manno-octulosonic-acid transferase